VKYWNGGRWDVGNTATDKEDSRGRRGEERSGREVK